MTEEAKEVTCGGCGFSQTFGKELGAWPDAPFGWGAVTLAQWGSVVANHLL